MAERPTGKLVVILHADVVGSTVLVQRDERRAHERITDAFHYFAQTIRVYGGQVHEIRGDALVAEFARTSDAVCAAVAFQLENSAHNKTLDDEIIPEIRVGISLGEVVIADDTVTGAGVVLAQRVEELAEPGGVCITEAIREATPDRLPLHVQSLGEQSLKGFEHPVQVHTVWLDPGAEIPPPEPREVPSRQLSYLIGTAVVAALVVILTLVWLRPWLPETRSASSERREFSLADKPSIAVLPFANLSDNPEQEYFADGITEDLTTDLSKISGLLVISRNSSFIYKNQTIDPLQVSRDLGVRYIVEGSVRRAGDKVRINAQLVDAVSGGHVWAERYDRKLTDILALQDDITHQIASALSVRLTSDEEQYLATNMTNNFEAYDLFLQGRRHYSSFTVEGFELAKALYRSAIGLDPGFTRAYSSLSITLVRLLIRGAVDSPAEALARAEELANRGLSIDPSSAHAHRALGFALIYQKQYDRALVALQRSIELAPNDGDGHAWLALLYNYMGRGHNAIHSLTKATELNPHYSWDYDYNRGRAYYSIGEYTQAAGALQDALERNENSILSRLYLAASYVRLDRQDDAEWEIMQIDVLDPSYTLSKVADSHPLQNVDLMEKFLDDLRSAGLPE